MKKPSLNLTLIIFALILLNLSCTSKNDNSENNIQVESNLKELISKNFMDASEEYLDKKRNPRCLEENGNIRFVRSLDWTSGFFPGCLWYTYEITGDTAFIDYARYYTELLEKEKFNDRTHDMGFKMMSSYGHGFRLTENLEYHEVLIKSAETLITRFNEKIGCIRSWDHNSDKWQFPVIIDNMMNLELLFWAFKETGDSVYYNIAVSHADRTIEEHFRSDYSSYHVVDYEPLTGEVVQKNTHQGFSDESAWSRGQAWGLYGFTMMFRETGDDKYLEQANHIAGFILSNQNMPDDLVPYWDFDAPGIPDEPRDASAAAIMASALYELGSFVDNKMKKNYYEYADKIMASLKSEKYLRGEDEISFFLLDHSTGNKPKDSEVDIPIIYADYYFLEALLRKSEIAGG